jgi:hypothetical protein
VLIYFQRVYLFFHHLSLDVVLGAAGGYALACKVLNIDISLGFVLTFGLGVWIIYLADHLLDSSNAANSPTPKYLFYIGYRKYLIGLILVISIIELVMVIKTLSLESVNAVFGLSGVLFIYFTAQHFLRGRLRKFFPKEIIITIIYIAAIWIIPLLQSGEPVAGYQLFIAVHFLLVLTNVSLFSLFEKEEDTLNHKGSCFTSPSGKSLKILILSFGTACLLGAMVLFPKSTYSVLPFIIISVVYLLEVFFARRAFIVKCYAQITDGAFLLFLIFFLPNFSI